MREGRWVTVTDSEFVHERRGLEAIRAQLPDTEPWRAWSNFVFTANSGHPREVDLLVIGPGQVCLIELKDWHGSVESRNGTWLQTVPNGRRRIPHGNPLHLANKKAKELAGLLSRAGQRVWVSEAVCFTDSSLQLRLPPGDMQGVFFVGDLIQHLKQPPRSERDRIDTARSADIARALKQIGLVRSDAEYRIGPYQLERKSFDSGPTWSDFLGRHAELPEAVRVRIYLRERGAGASLRASVERAALREAAVLRRFQHPGVVRLKQYDSAAHSAGPALIFDYDPRTLRLDTYLAQYGERLDILARMALVRQLAETVRSAHSARLYHRTLAANAVHVIPRGRTGAGADSDERPWLTPHLQISDWQVAVARGTDSGPSGAQAGAACPAATALSQAGAHLAEGADPYLAPELTALGADPIALDIYGLGVLTYLLATGQAPAASQAELVARLEAGEGLRPSAVVDGLSEYIDELVQAATAYRPEDRIDTVDEFLDMLETVEEDLTAPAAEAQDAVEADAEEKDPLEAAAGDLLDGRWEVKRRLGTGSTSRAFLVRDLTAASAPSSATARRPKALAVLKVALSDSRGDVLRREAEVMGRLRPDSGIIRLVEPEPQTIGGRTVLVMEYVGDERDTDSGPAPSGTGSRTRRREETVARQLREQGRLTVDQLEAYGDYLFRAVDFLEGEGVWHRDIKPDNIAIRIRPNRTRELVLIDFSLAGYPVQEVSAGTEGYLDPFVETITRGVYDAHAERYAVAATLHEMASGELPVWGDGKVSARQTDPRQQPYATIAADAFDPAVRNGLSTFFRRALHRDARERFSDLKPMRDAWKKIFLAMDEAVPSSRPSRHKTASATGPGAIDEAETLTAQQQRDKRAAAAQRTDAISAVGFSPAAESFVHGLGVTTVGELLDYSQRQLVNAPGLGSKTRKEVLGRIRQWREKFAEAPAAPLTPQGRKAAKEELRALSDAEAALADQLATEPSPATAAGLSEQALRGVSLDALATIFVPELKKNGANANEVAMVQLLLRLPDEHGALPPVTVWPRQKDVAQVLPGVGQARVSQLLKQQRTRWKKHPAVRALRTEIIELLHGLGRVAPAAELADALAVRRGTQLQGRDQRRALALAAVRAVIEVEQLAPDNQAFRHIANRDAADEGVGAGLLALEVGDDDGPDTPSAPGLLDYAQRLGRAADHLAKLDTLPTSAAVLSELGAVPPPQGVLEWDERRLVELAAASSRRAAATPRLEIYPRDLPLVRALRLTQAGLVRLIPGLAEARQPGLTAAEIHERVRARFPELLDERGGHVLPEGSPLTSALREAGFDLELKTREGTAPRTQRYLPRKFDAASSYLTSDRSGSTATGAARVTRYADDPEVAVAAASDERLRGAARRDGFRVLTVSTGSAGRAVRMLGSGGAAGSAGAGRIGAEVVSVASLFLGALHELVDARPKPTWETILKADVAPPGSKSAMRFAEYAQTAWGLVEPRLADLLESRGPAPGAHRPLLLVDGGVFARYGAMGVLDRLAERARGGGPGLWLLCPQDDPTRDPRLGTVSVPYQTGLGEWIPLTDAWVRGTHRVALPGQADGSGEKTVSVDGGAGSGEGSAGNRGEPN
ncbi:BREX system serine/threonine kinase PglW [Streptomyces aculeolatus]